ncbi:hypothetical protein NECAME_17184 [Necator americanus]|uniref:WD domain, G-beta repeat protein n=1 Tax=Necator americanus TaxID=51031 RepID=W2TR78_NECAM|nr:hypothetical protein NECAME_17184 [Necator americanus]ETN84273.1 hypothetical protein NECAME_17184 [Necator americanus]
MALLELESLVTGKKSVQQGSLRSNLRRGLLRNMYVPKLSSGELLAAVDIHYQRITRIALSADESVLFTASADGNISCYLISEYHLCAARFLHFDLFPTGEVFLPPNTCLHILALICNVIRVKDFWHDEVDHLLSNLMQESEERRESERQQILDGLCPVDNFRRLFECVSVATTPAQRSRACHRNHRASFVHELLGREWKMFPGDIF